MNNYHTSVLLQESIDLLQVRQGEQYIDATLGGGGHTIEIVKRGGKVLGIDVDKDALEYVEQRIKNTELGIKKENITLAQGNFASIPTIAMEHGFESVSGILFDLGVSSHQFDTPERGFSFQHDAALDMRMDRNLTVSAKDLVNGLGRSELAELFMKLGEEPFAKKVANQIVKARSFKPIETTAELASIVRSVIFSKSTATHPATRVFQALRIAVNDELNVLKDALANSLTVLRPGGRLVVITFHSLEDRIVKEDFKQFEKEKKGLIVTDKPMTPTTEEIQQNSRSRSAKLRGFEML